MWAGFVFACSEPIIGADVKPLGFDDPAVTESSETSEPPNPTDPPDPPGSTTPEPNHPPLLGFIGSPCDSDADCPYEGGICLPEADGFPDGHCSAVCDEYCDDAEGYPTTFCVAADAVLDAPDLGGAGCVSRCDFASYPYEGCREGYGCLKTPRANDPDTETWACLPGAAPPLPSCLADLAGRGVPFSFPIIADAVPADAPSLVCHVEEPIAFHPGYLGVDLQFDDDPPAPVEGACAMGQALADSIEDVADDGVVAIHHFGTYVCRTIAGTSTLSRHAYGDAIDVARFTFDDGSVYSVLDDWETDDPTPESVAGAWLYDTAYGWHDALLWNVILTPDYNAAHANHFHLDLTPGSDFIQFRGPGVFGPSPWPGE